MSSSCFWLLKSPESRSRLWTWRHQHAWHGVTAVISKRFAWQTYCKSTSIKTWHPISDDSIKIKWNNSFWWKPIFLVKGLFGLPGKLFEWMLTNIRCTLPGKNKSPLKIGRNSQMTANIHLTWPPCLSVENNLKLYRSKHVLPKRTGKKNDINTRLTTISIELTMNSWKQDMKCETPLKLINDWIYYSLFGCEWKKRLGKILGPK